MQMKNEHDEKTKDKESIWMKKITIKNLKHLSYSQ